MKIYFNLDENNYVDGVSSSSFGFEYSADIEDDHEVLRNPVVFKYEDGELIKDDDKLKKLKEEAEKENSKPTDLEVVEQSLVELAKKIVGDDK